jgi:hypothetical protein
MACFRLADFCVMIDGWFFNIFRPCAILIFSTIWLTCDFNEYTPYILFAVYLGYLALHLVSILITLNYSTDRLRDLLVCAVWPLVPFYLLYLRIVLFTALMQELFARRSFQDNFVPQRVREKTWHW